MQYWSKFCSIYVLKFLIRFLYLSISSMKKVTSIFMCWQYILLEHRISSDDKKNKINNKNFLVWRSNVTKNTSPKNSAQIYLKLYKTSKKKVSSNVGCIRNCILHFDSFSIKRFPRNSRSAQLDFKLWHTSTMVYLIFAAGLTLLFSCFI